MKKVAYLGTKGAFSEMAVIKYFGEGNVDAVPYPDFTSMFEAVRDGSSDYAMFPVENTTTGMITRTYDLFQYYDLYACGEVLVPVNECLITVQGAELKDIKEIYSHPEAISQCAGFFRRHPEFKPIVFGNTATAVRFIKEQNDPSKAALASSLAAKIFGLPVLLENVQDNKNNITRFLCVSAEKRTAEGADKISAMLVLKHDTGALYRALGVLAGQGINLLMIQSRPIPGKVFDYCFYLDFEGSFSNPDTAEALRRLKYDCEEVKIIGNYRAAVL